MSRSQGSLVVESPQDLARRLALPITDYRLLLRALTHRSYINEHPEALEDNERLEFLGDAVLDFLVGAWLYNHYPEMAEGALTRLRSALVRTEQLADFARQIDLGGALRLGRGEADSGGRTRPAMLCAAFEALVGALYLDAGIDAVRSYLEPLLEPVAEEILDTHRERDPKSILQETLQSQGYDHPVYYMVDERGPDHDKVFVMEVRIDDRVVGRGEGHSKQAAAKHAARAALEYLGIDWWANGLERPA